MTTKRVAKRGTSRKTTEAADQLTAERIRAILSDPKTPEGAKRRLRRLVSNFSEWAEPFVAETPEFFADAFAQAAGVLREGRSSDFFLSKARPFYERAVALAAEREPKDAALVRRLSEVLADPKRGDEHRAILVTLNDLSNTTGASDLHPDIFPTLARVVIREARKYARGRSESARAVGRFLRGLEMLAGE